MEAKHDGSSIKQEGQTAENDSDSKEVPVIEESVGDAELGLVLKEAAIMWTSDKGYAKELSTWINSNLHDFTDCVGEDLDTVEHKFSYSTLHEEYLSVFESQMERFVNRERYSIEDFFQECRGALDDSMCALFSEHDEKWFVQSLLAAIDYKEWLKMMVEHAAEKQEKDADNRGRK